MCQNNSILKAMLQIWHSKIFFLKFKSIFLGRTVSILLRAADFMANLISFHVYILHQLFPW